MRMTVFSVLLLATLALAGKFQFASGPCTLIYNTNTNRFSYSDSCFVGTTLFRLECNSFLHPRDVSEIHFVFYYNDGIKLLAYDSRSNSIGYSASAFGRDLEEGRISTCQISYNANPKEIWGRE